MLSADTPAENAHLGLRSAVQAVLFGAAVQRRVHFMRNVLARVPKGNSEMVAAAFAQAHPAVAAHVSVLSTRHPGRQAFIGTAKQRALWQEQQAEVFEQAGTLLGYRERSDTRARP